MCTCVSLQAVYDGEGWISVGFSDDGRMVPADAVIGLPDEATALEYFLTNKVRIVGEGTPTSGAYSTAPFASSPRCNHRTELQTAVTVPSVDQERPIDTQ